MSESHRYTLRRTHPGYGDIPPSESSDRLTKSSYSSSSSCELRQGSLTRKNVTLIRPNIGGTARAAPGQKRVPICRYDEEAEGVRLTHRTLFRSGVVVRAHRRKESDDDAKNVEGSTAHTKPSKSKTHDGQRNPRLDMETRRWR